MYEQVYSVHQNNSILLLNIFAPWRQPGARLANTPSWEIKIHTHLIKRIYLTRGIVCIEKEITSSVYTSLYEIFFASIFHTLALFLKKKPRFSCTIMLTMRTTASSNNSAVRNNLNGLIPMPIIKSYVKSHTKVNVTVAHPVSMQISN